jgi:hypothetical protein
MVNHRLDDDGALVVLDPVALDPRVARLAQRFVETQQVLGGVNLPPITSIMYGADSFPSRQVVGQDRHNAFGEQNAPFWLNDIDPAFIGWNDDGTWWVLIRSDVKLGTVAGQKVLKLRIHDTARMWNVTNIGGLTAHDNTVGSGDCDNDASNAQRLAFDETAATDQVFNDWVRKSAKLVTRAAADGIAAFTGKDFCGQYTYAYVFMLSGTAPSNNGWIGHTAAGHVRLYAASNDFYVGVEIDGVAPSSVQADMVHLVPNEAARVALTPPDGALVVQQDTGWTWRYQASFAGDAFYSPWRVFSDYVGAASVSARDALAPHLHVGTLVSVGGIMYEYAANPNTAAGQPPGVWRRFGPHLYGKWELHDNYFGTPTGPDTVIHRISAANVTIGHLYLVTVVASGFMCTDASVTEAKYAIGISDSQGVAWLSSQNAKVHRGQFAGLINFPVSLSGIWKATSTNKNFDFRFLHTGYQDWILDIGHHLMYVLDLGPDT